MEGGLTYYDLYSDRCSWRDILHNLPWKDFKTREDGKMVKVRLQGVAAPMSCRPSDLSTCHGTAHTLVTGAEAPVLCL